MPRRFAPVSLLLAWTILLTPAIGRGQTATPADRPARKAPAPRNPLEGLGGYIEEAMKRWQIPGLAIGIVKDDHLVYAKGFGVRELGRPEKVTEKTFFAMAS